MNDMTQPDAIGFHAIRNDAGKREPVNVTNANAPVGNPNADYNYYSWHFGTYGGWWNGFPRLEGESK